jgi:hypothetical protein
MRILRQNSQQVWPAGARTLAKKQPAKIAQVIASEIPCLDERDHFLDHGTVAIVTQGPGQRIDGDGYVRTLSGQVNEPAGIGLCGG